MAEVNLEFTFEIDNDWTLDAVQSRAERVMQLLLAEGERNPALGDQSTASSGHTVAVAASLKVTDSVPLAALKLRKIVRAAVYDISAFPFGVMTHFGVRDLDLETDE